MFIDNKRNVCKLLWNKKAKILYYKIINLINNNKSCNCLTITDARAELEKTLDKLSNLSEVM